MGSVKRKAAGSGENLPRHSLFTLLYRTLHFCSKDFNITKVRIRLQRQLSTPNVVERIVKTVDQRYQRLDVLALD